VLATPLGTLRDQTLSSKIGPFQTESAEKFILSHGSQIFYLKKGRFLPKPRFCFPTTFCLDRAQNSLTAVNHFSILGERIHQFAEENDGLETAI